MPVAHSLYNGDQIGQCQEMTSEDASNKFCKDVLALDESLTFCCLVDSLGNVITSEYSETPFLNEKEAELYAIQMTLSAALLSLFEPKMGGIKYMVTYRDKINQKTAPVLAGDHKLFLLLLVDIDSDIARRHQDRDNGADRVAVDYQEEYSVDLRCHSRLGLEHKQGAGRSQKMARMAGVHSHFSIS